VFRSLLGEPLPASIARLLPAGDDVAITVAIQRDPGVRVYENEETT
jgi:hypothetical protein